MTFEAFGFDRFALVDMEDGFPSFKQNLYLPAEGIKVMDILFFQVYVWRIRHVDIDGT